MLDRLLINFHTALMLTTLVLTSIALGIYLGRGPLATKVAVAAKQRCLNSPGRLMRASIIQAAIAVTALTTIGAALPAAAEPNKLPPAFLGDWCRIGGTGKVIGRPAPWIYQRGRCPNPHYRLIVRSNGVTDRGQLCLLIDTFEGSSGVLARFNCGCKDGQTCPATYWLSLTPGGRLQKLVAQR